MDTMILYILDLEQFRKNEYCEELSKHQRNHAAGQYLLRFALGEEAYRKAEFATGEHGKPYIKDHSIHYNISHSGQYAVLVVANSEVGVDVQEKKGKRMEATAKRFFSQEEQRVFEACKTPERQVDLFFHIWCRKEAYGKCLGVGLNEQVLRTNVLQEMPGRNCDDYVDELESVQKDLVPMGNHVFHDINVLEGYHISICSRKEERIEKIIRIFEGL